MKWSYPVPFVLAFGLLGCLEATGPQPSFPDRLVPVGATEFEGVPGFALTDSVRVKFVDTNGIGIEGQTVEFVVQAGGGAVSPASAVTNAEGIASAEWRLGSTPGENVLRAGAAGMDVDPVTLRATGRESPGSEIIPVSSVAPGPYIGGCSVDQPVRVRVTDAAGQPVAGASVGFVIEAGGGTVEPTLGLTNASGEASAVWRVGEAGGANALRAQLQTRDLPSVRFEAQSLPIAPGGFVTIGNRIYNSDCEVHHFHGVARPSLQWTPGGDEHIATVEQDFALMKTWNANVVRIALNQSYWLAGTAQHDPTYKQRVIDVVTKARAAGLAVILDLHVSDRGDPNFNLVPDVQQMADVRHSVPFWTDVANTFKHDGKIIFELYNEPNEISWDVWLNGGMIPSGPKYPGGPYADGFEAVGMQQLYNTVRATGARNLIIVNGIHWGYQLDGVLEHEVQGYNIAYGTHPYDWPDKQPDTWEAAWGYVADVRPVIITEFGAYSCSRLEYYEALLDFARERNLSWIAWAWWTPPPVSADFSAEERREAVCRFPALLEDWSGTPSISGTLIKQQLSLYPR